MSEDMLDKKIIASLKSRRDIVNEKLLVSRTMELTDLGRELISLGLVVKDEVAAYSRAYSDGKMAPGIFPQV